MMGVERSLQQEQQAVDWSHTGVRPVLQRPAQCDDEWSQSISSLVASLLCFPGDLKASIPGQHNEPDISQAGVAIHLHRHSRSTLLVCFTGLRLHHHGSSDAGV